MSREGGFLNSKSQEIGPNQAASGLPLLYFGDQTGGPNLGRPPDPNPLQFDKDAIIDPQIKNHSAEVRGRLNRGRSREQEHEEEVMQEVVEGSRQSGDAEQQFLSSNVSRIETSLLELRGGGGEEQGISLLDEGSYE